MIAVSMVRDEADVIRMSVTQLWEQDVDRIVVLDNGSTDGTIDILHELGCTVLDQPDALFMQGHRLTELADRYAEEGEWVIPFDADELWTVNLEVQADVLRCRPWVVRPNGARSHQEPLWKCMCRWRSGCRIEAGQHAILGTGPVVLDNLISIEHHQYRTLEQVKRKVRNGAAALEQASEHPNIGTHWRELAAKNDEELEAWWRSYTA